MRFAPSHAPAGQTTDSRSLGAWDSRQFRCGQVTFAAGFAGLILCSTTLPALAQNYVPGVYESGQDNNLSPDISLDTRFLRRQLPVGAQIGAFSIAPSLQVDESFNDNIFATPSATQSDAITTLTGRTSIDYAHGINTLDVQGWFAQQLYAIHPSENNWQGSVQVNFASAVHDDLQLVLNGDLKRLVDPRTDPSGVQGLTPTTYQVYDGSVGALAGHYENSLFDLRVGFDRTIYNSLEGSQGPIITSDRDYTEIFATGNYHYSFGTGRDLYIKVRPDTRDYDDKFDQSGFQRSSNGVRVDAGADWNIDSALLLNLESGYQRQAYDDPRFGTIGVPDGLIKLSWWPSLLTNVTLNGVHEYYEAFFTPSPGAVRNKIVARVDHELRRRWLVSASVTLERDSLLDVSTRYTSQIADLALRYEFAEGFSAGVDYTFSHQNSTGVTVTTGATSFLQNIVTFTVKKLF